MRIPCLKGRILLLPLSLAAILCIQACTTPRGLVAPTAPPYNSEEIDAILGRVHAQGNLVNTLFCTGKLTSREGDAEQEADIAIVGRRTPFQVKMEITHPWGPTIADLFLDENRFVFLFFPKKRMYVGPMSGKPLNHSLPLPLDPAAVWAFARGFPPVPPGYVKAVSPKKGVISLLDGRNVLLLRLEFDQSTLKPEACYFPGTGLTEYYEDFEKDDSVEFAQRVTLKDTSRKKSLVLLVRHALFNPHLPSGVFDIKKPEGFKTIVLSREVPAH